MLSAVQVPRLVIGWDGGSQQPIMLLNVRFGGEREEGSHNFAPFEPSF